MGNNALFTRTTGQTIEADDVNQYFNALSGNVLPRDASGNVIDAAGNLGSASEQWASLYLSGNVILNGTVVDLLASVAESNQVVSGRIKTSGYPDYLGFTVGINTGSILGATTPLSLLINGTAVTVNSNISLVGLATAPSSNNTCLVNDATLTGTNETRLLGPDGRQLTIDTIGSSITALNGTVQPFKRGNEILLAFVDTTNNRLLPFMRGIGSTDRETLSDNDSLTLLRANHIFIDDDGATTYRTIVWPEFQDTDPSGVSGQFYFNTASKQWRQFTASWAQINAIYLGMIITDNTQCIAAHPVDFYRKWKNDLACSLTVVDADTLRVRAPRISVAGRDFESLDYAVDIKMSVTGDREAGISETANTLYYVYCDQNMKFRFSTVAPRAFDHRQGLYHPKEYWRAIGRVFNDASSALISPETYSANERRVSYRAEKALMSPNSMGNATWDSNNTLSIPWFCVANDSTRDILIQKNSTTQINTDNTGANGIAQSANLAGTASCSGTTVTGAGTSFQSDFIVGDVIWFNGGAARRITAIASQTSMTVESALTQASTTYRRGGKAPNTIYNTYAIASEGGAQPALLLSTRSAKHSEALLDLPAGYLFSTQLPHYIELDSSSNQVPYTVTGGPWNFSINLDQHLGNLTTAGPVPILTAGGATTFTAISLANRVPRIAAAVTLKADALYAGSVSESRVRKGGSNSEGYSMLAASSSQRSMGNPIVGLNATREIEYRNTVASAQLSLWIMTVHLSVA